MSNNINYHIKNRQELDYALSIIYSNILKYEELLMYCEFDGGIVFNPQTLICCSKHNIKNNECKMCLHNHCLDIINVTDLIRKEKFKILLYE